eukprot:s9111_g3.t1
MKWMWDPDPEKGTRVDGTQMGPVGRGGTRMGPGQQKKGTGDHPDETSVGEKMGPVAPEWGRAKNGTLGVMVTMGVPCSDGSDVWTIGADATVHSSKQATSRHVMLKYGSGSRLPAPRARAQRGAAERSTDAGHLSEPDSEAAPPEEAPAAPWSSSVRVLPTSQARRVRRGSSHNSGLGASANEQKHLLDWELHLVHPEVFALDPAFLQKGMTLRLSISMRHSVVIVCPFFGISLRIGIRRKMLRPSSRHELHGAIATPRIVVHTSEYQ